jgi:thymidylate synthase
MIVNAWNPASLQANKVCLPPCHVMTHFDIIDGEMHFMMYQRSADLLLGVAYNTPSYELLGHLISHITGYPLVEFVHVLGDHHIYENHFESVRAQIQRKPYPSPHLWISPDIKEIDDFRLDKMIKRIETEDDFVSGRRKPITVIDDYVKLIDYRHHDKLPGDQRMAV